MASTTQDTLYDVFSNAAGSQAEALEPITSASDELAESLQSVTEQMSGGPSQDSAEASPNQSQSGASEALSIAIPNTAGSQAEALEPITSASDELAESLQSVTPQMGGVPSQDSAATSPNASKSGASEALSIATTVLESGLGMIPLVTGLIGLFSGGDSTPTPLTKYAMPDKIDFEGADTGSGTSDMDYDQMGTPRTYNASPASSSSPASSLASPALSPPSPASSPASAPSQITVNVQAMDSQSFLDHSSDIAQAVRNAMLNMSSINDLVSEL